MIALFWIGLECNCRLVEFEVRKGKLFFVYFVLFCLSVFDTNCIQCVCLVASSPGEFFSKFIMYILVCLSKKKKGGKMLLYFKVLSECRVNIFINLNLAKTNTSLCLYCNWCSSFIRMI